MAESLTLQVPNKHDAIEPASTAAETWLEQQGAGPQAAYLVLLAIEELVTNCIKYAYDDEEEHTITIALSENAGTVTMMVVDDGHPFDPLGAPPPDRDVPVEDRSVGGLGLFLLRNMADVVTYERRDGTNRLTLTKRLV